MRSNDSSPAESKVIRYVRKTWATREAYEHGPSFNEDEVVDVTDEVAALRAERDRWQRRAQTGDTIAQDCIDELREALAWHLDDDECSLDHHGGCQTHDPNEGTRECMVAQHRRLLEATSEQEATDA